MTMPTRGKGQASFHFSHPSRLPPMGAFWGPDVTGHDGAELPMSFAAHSRHLSASGDELHPASGPLRSSRFVGNPRHAAYPPSSTPSSSHSQSLPLLSALLGSSNRASLFAFPDGPGSSEHRYGPPGTGSPFQFPPTSGDLHGHRPLHESHAPTMQDWQGSIHEGVERIVRQDSQTGEFYYEGSRHYMGENRGRHPSPVEMQYTHHAQELSRSASSPLLIPQLTSSLLASHDPSSNLHLINPFSESPSLSARQHPPHLDTSQSEPLPSTSTGSNGSSQLTIGSLLQSLPLSTSLAPSSPSGGSHPGNDPSVRDVSRLRNLKIASRHLALTGLSSHRSFDHSHSSSTNFSVIQISTEI